MSHGAVPIASADADLLVGVTLNGRFRIVEKLGMGGMGSVYKAIQLPMERPVALKLLHPSYDTQHEEGFQRRFFLEASTTSKLNHPNTITVLDYGKADGGLYYLAMEYVEGKTLAQLLAQLGRLSWPRVLNIAQQVCRSVREAHRAGIIHRDLKPANIMVVQEDESEQVKVLDFGLVKSFLPDAIPESSGSGLTMAGTFMGSPLYMSPEQARNQADVRSDIYSLGVTLFQALTGVPPFAGEQSIDVILMHLKQIPPSFREVCPDIECPANVENMVRKCLEKSPERRYQSMDELLDAVRAAWPNRMAVAQTPWDEAFIEGPRQKPAQISEAQAITLTGDIPVVAAAVAEIPVAESPAAPLSEAPLQLTEVVPQTDGPPKSFRGMPPLPPYQEKRSSGLVPVIAVSLILGGFVWYVFQPPSKKGGTETAEAQTLSSDSAPAPAAGAATAGVPVKFRIVSQPAGARVSMEGKELGTTPLDFEMAPGSDGRAAAQLTVALDGFLSQTVLAAGTGPTVVLNLNLEKESTEAAESAK
jgi:serine/threonine-protein kinase